MTDFIKKVREDGSIEYINPNYDELIAAAEADNTNDAPVVLSTEQIAADQLLCLRNMRDKKLAETDWSQGADVPDVLKTKYREYRQALRDITKTYSSYEDVVWPTKPE